MKQYYSLLKTMPLFGGIEETEIEQMLQCLNAHLKKFQKNSIILNVDDKITSVGIVLSGNVQIIKEDILGNKLILTKLFPGDLFGETLVCANVSKSPVRIFSTNDSEILYLDYKKIINTCSSSCDFHSKLIENMLFILAKKNLMLNDKIDVISKRSIKEKIIAYLLNEIDKTNNLTITIPYTRNELADYLCVDRSALSRELSKMQEEGIIKFHKNRFQLLK